MLHPLALPGAEIEGVHMFEEVSGADGVILWNLLRAVLSWSAGPHAENGRCAAEPKALERMEHELLSRGADPLGAPGGLLAGYMARPDVHRKDDVAWACICICEWALEQRFGRTGAGFAVAAAVAAPRNARYACVAAHLVRRHRRLPEAEHWFRRAHRVATWTDDWACQVQALIGWADVLGTLGSGRRAVQLCRRAIRIAARRGLDAPQAEAEKKLVEIEAARASSGAAWGSEHDHHSARPGGGAVSRPAPR